MQANIFVTEPANQAMTWSVANRQNLETELARLRLLLERRVVWLRQQWKHDPLQNYAGLVISDAQADSLLNGENRAAEARFYRADERVREINSALTEIERNLKSQREAFSQFGRSAALDTLALLFGLSPFERNVLLLCFAPELDASFERLYAYVQDDVTRKQPTPALALALFEGAGEDGLDARNAFLPAAPLRHSCLVHLDANANTISNASLHLDATLAEFLLTANVHLDARLVNVVRSVTSSPLPPSQVELVEQLQRWIESDVPGGMWRGLNLVGSDGAGKRSVARAVCERVGWQLIELDLTRLPDAGAERSDFLRLLERDANLARLAIYLDTSRMDAADKSLTASAAEVIRQCGVFIVVGSRERWQSEHALLMVRVPKPDAGSRGVLWHNALVNVNHSVDGQLDEIVHQFETSPSDIPHIVAAAQGRARLRGPDDDACVTADDLWQACRDQASAGMDELAQRITPCYTWLDIVLPDEIILQLREVAGQVTHRAQVYETWGFAAKLSRGRGINALFAGPSGTGKTMAAEVLANHLKLDLYRIDLAGVVSKYIGETEKNLRRVFDAAEQSGAILFFDEADALFGKRSEVKDSHDRYANIEINYLLQRMEDYRGLAILATNMKSLLDQAFLRRLRYLIDFPFPDANLRQRIWQNVFPPSARVEGLDYERLARLEIPGGNIKNIAVNAAFMAANEGTPIRMSHILRAARREYTKLDRLVPESEFSGLNMRETR